MNTSFQRIFSTAFIFIFILTIIKAVPARAAAAADPAYYVNSLAAPGGDGLSWATAFKDLQSAINAVNITPGCAINTCQIWVVQGSYNLEEGHNIHINGGYEAIYGGFTGAETELSQRNWKTHLTSLVGNNSNVVYAYGFMGVLDGFTITGGHTAPNGRGGGIYLECSAPGLSNLNIVGNWAGTYGGGVYAYSMGCPTPGYYPRLLNVVVTGNTATYGGGIALLGSNPTLINAVISGNSATQGNGIYNYHSSPILTNVSMSVNGIHNNLQSSPTIQNSIIWGLLPNAITNEESTSIPNITHSLLQDCKPSGIWNSLCGTDGGHNLADINPDFVDEALPDLHLKPASPAIDQGDNTLIPGYLTSTDLDGNSRIVGLAVDLGAYEFQSANIPPVVTNFTRTGWKDTDLSFLAADFTTHYSDADGDNLVSIRITFLPTQGTLYLAATPVTVGQEIPFGSLGSLHFTPPSGWSGTVSFGWSASDGKAYSPNPAVVTMKIFSFQAFLPVMIK